MDFIVNNFEINDLSYKELFLKENAFLTDIEQIIIRSRKLKEK